MPPDAIKRYTGALDRGGTGEPMHAWHMWAIVALLLALLELFGAHFVLLGLGLAAAVVAIVVGIAPGTGIGAQLLIFIVASLLIVPAIIVVFRRYYPGGGVSVMNEPGGRAAEPHEVIERDGQVGVEIYGDFYPARFPTTGLEPEPGMIVVIQEFRGIVAMVKVLSDDNATGE